MECWQKRGYFGVECVPGSDGLTGNRLVRCLHSSMAAPHAQHSRGL